MPGLLQGLLSQTLRAHMVDQASAPSNLSCTSCKRLSDSVPCSGCFKVFCSYCVSPHPLTVDGVELEPIPLCNPCKQATERENRIEERWKRIECVIAGHPKIYDPPPETKLKMAIRLTSSTLSGAHSLAGWLPIPLPGGQWIKKVILVVRYGPLVMFTEQILAILKQMIGMATSINCDRSKVLNPKFLLGLYYMMAETEGRRSEQPDLEHREHVGQGAGNQVSPQQLKNLQHMLRFVNVVCKETATADRQRLLRLFNHELAVASNKRGDVERAFLLVLNPTDRFVYLILPGTSTMEDVQTDLSVDSEEVCTNSARGLGHQGMTKSAKWLEEEVGPLLLRLAKRGYIPTIVGYSLGAGVGALLTLLLKDKLPALQCFGFGTPACIDENLIPALLDVMVSVVNHDDVVPRASCWSVEKLVAAVTCEGQAAKTEEFMRQDLEAASQIKERLQLQRRQTGVPRSPPISEILTLAEVDIVRQLGIDQNVFRQAWVEENGDFVRAVGRAVEEGFHEPMDAEDLPLSEASTQTPTPTATIRTSSFLNLFSRSSSSVSDSLTPAEDVPQKEGIRLYVPGTVIHLYQRNGWAHAVTIPAAHEVLDHIVISQTMLEDHFVPAYEDALNQALKRPPRLNEWQPSDVLKLCACCDHEFSWSQPAQSPLQKLLARRHCHFCGRAVCPECSKHTERRPMPNSNSVVRKCDICVFSEPEFGQASSSTSRL